MIVAFLATCSFNSFANYYSIPEGYQKVDTTKGTSVYYNNSDKVVVQVINLENAYLENKYIRKNSNGNFTIASMGVFKNSSGAFSVINGAFFDNEKSPSTPVSFPFTPGNDE